MGKCATPDISTERNVLVAVVGSSLAILGVQFAALRFFFDSSQGAAMSAHSVVTSPVAYVGKRRPQKETLILQLSVKVALLLFVYILAGLHLRKLCILLSAI